MVFKIPDPVYKPRFSITRASDVVHRVRDLAASRKFYVDLLGLAVSDESPTTLWLRGIEEGCHHSLVLKEIGQVGCERVGMRVLTEEDLDLAHANSDSVSDDISAAPDDGTPEQRPINFDKCDLI